MIDIQDYNLLNDNTFGIEETCRRYISFDTVDELRKVLLSLIPSDGESITRRRYGYDVGSHLL